MPRPDWLRMRCLCLLVAGCARGHGTGADPEYVQPAPALPVVKSLSVTSFFVEGGGAPLLVRGSGFASSTAILRVRPASSATQLDYSATVAKNCTVISDKLLHCPTPPGPVLAPGPGQADVCNGWSGVDDGCKVGWSNAVAVEYDYLIDVAVGRRPYLKESKGHLLLRSNASLVGHGGVTVVASLPSLASAPRRDYVLAVWKNITLNGSNTLEFSLGSLPATVNTDLKVVVSARWLEADFNDSVVKWRRFMRAADCHATASCGAVPVQVDHARRGLLVGGETFFATGWFTGTGDNYWSPNDAHAWQRDYPTPWAGTMEMIQMQARLGDNIMMAYGLDELNTTNKLRFLDQCAQYGMKVMYPLGEPLAGGAAAHFDNASMNTTSGWLFGNVSAVRNHSAILGYYICDDCCGGQSSVSEQAQLYNAIKQLDPFHIIVGALQCWSAFWQWSDVLSATGCPGSDSPCRPQSWDSYQPAKGAVIPVGEDPRLQLSLDVIMWEDYHQFDYPPLSDAPLGKEVRRGTYWEPLINCYGLYDRPYPGETEHETIHPNSPTATRTAMWLSVLLYDAPMQLTFVLDGAITCSARTTP